MIRKCKYCRNKLNTSRGESQIYCEKNPNKPKERSGIHSLKIHPEFYRAVAEGRKTYEVRKFDRDFRVGDTVELQEWDPSHKIYTGRQLSTYISYITAPGSWDLPKTVGVFGIVLAKS